MANKMKRFMLKSARDMRKLMINNNASTSIEIDLQHILKKAEQQAKLNNSFVEIPKKRVVEREECRVTQYLYISSRNESMLYSLGYNFEEKEDSYIIGWEE